MEWRLLDPSLYVMVVKMIYKPLCFSFFFSSYNLNYLINVISVTVNNLLFLFVCLFSL